MADEVKQSNWYWQDLGGGATLFENDQHRSVVLCGFGRYAKIGTRDDRTGVLRELKCDEPVARMVAIAPELVGFVDKWRGWFAATGRENAFLEEAEQLLRRVGIVS